MHKNRFSRGFSNFTNLFIITILGLNAVLTPASVVVAAPAESPLVGVFTTCVDVTEIPQAECEALVALYNSTNGTSWTTNTDWLQTDTPCSWYGVSCASGYVDNLYLPSNNLTGTLPTAIDGLTNLRVLSLSANNLTGTIPSQFGNLTNLQYLWLNTNSLSGSIPEELGNMSSMTHLVLEGNQFSGVIPGTVGNLSNLTYLNISTTSVSGTIPASLGNLINLQELWLFETQLSGNIPSELTSLINLTKLGLHNNQLTGNLPTNIGDLVNLEHLSLANNQLSGEIPLSITNLVNLTHLTLGCGLASSDPTVMAFLDSHAVDNWRCVNVIAVRTDPGEIDSVTARGWAYDTPLTLTIDDPSTPESPESGQTYTGNIGYAPWDASVTWIKFPLTLKLEPGFVVNVTGGGISKEFTVASVEITEVDFDADTVTGTAASGSGVHAHVEISNGSQWYDLDVVTDSETGIWLADFTALTDLPQDLVVDVEAAQSDGQGGSTRYWRWYDPPYVPNTRFHAQIVENNVQGYDWPLGDSVTLTIDDPINGMGVDFTDTQIVIVAPWDATRTKLSFNDLGGLTLAPGMLITLTDGSLTKVHTVTDLVVTGVDVDLDTVWGTGTPDTNLNVQYCGNNGCNWRRWATVQPDGTWQVDFSVAGGATFEEQNILDIQPGMQGEALQVDDDTDITDYAWYVHNPIIEIQPGPGYNWIHATDWPIGNTVTVTVDNDTDPGNGYVFQQSKVVEPAPWDSGIGSVQFDTQRDDPDMIFPGQFITMTDSVTTKTLVVDEVHFDYLNLDTDIAGGRGPANRLAEVSVWTGTENFLLDITIGSDGNWVADFGANGMDIQTIAGNNIRVFDEDGDFTEVHLDPPIVFALINENQVHGYGGWLGESTVTLTVDDPGTPANPDYTAGQIVVENSDLTFNLPFEGQLAPGFVLNMSDGTTSRDLTIANLTVNIDLGTDAFSGTAEPNAEVWIDVWQDDNQRHVVADGTGAWMADFSVPGDENFEQNTTDLRNGFDGEVYTQDADGDYTAYKWEANWTAPADIPLVVGVNGWIDLSPLSFDYSSWTVASLLWEPLLRMAEDGSLSYAAAQSYAVSPDGLTYTFTLRPDGSWSDGQPVTAQNFVDGFLRILDPNAGYDYAYLLYPIAGAEDYNTGVTSDPNTVGLAALNATTLEITLHSPAIFFPQVLAVPGMVPVRQDLIDLYGDNWVSPANIVSSGAYLYTTSDRGYDILERNPDYRDAGQVAYSKIAFARYLNPYELVQAYRDGEVDAILQAPVRPTVNDPALATDLVESIDLGTMFVTFNAQSGRVTAEPLVRKALSAAIDRRSLLDSALESSWRTEAQGVIPPDMLGYQGNSVGYGYNLTQAQQFMSDAGYPNGSGFPELVILAYDSRRSIFEELANQWRTNLNIPVRVDYYSDGYGARRGACFDDPANCIYDVNMVGWYLDYYDPNNVMNDAFYPPTSWQFGWWDSLPYRNAVDASRGETDPATRIQNLQAAEQILVETDLAVAPLYFIGDLHLVNSGIYPAFGAMIPYLDQWGNSDVDADGIHDLIDPCPEDDTNTCAADGSAAGVVGSGGGTVTTENNNVNMDIPPGAVTNETTFTITDQGKGYIVSTDQGPIEAITSVEIGPGGTTFAVPVPLTFSWPDADNDDIVDGTSYAETALQLSKDGIVIATCSDLPGPCDFASNTITVEVSSLSIFVVGAANFSETLTPLIPSGTLTDWDHTFSWDGLSNATWYLLEVQTSAGTQVFRKWYTSTQSGCTGGTACSVTQADLSLANGDYKWRVMDYGAYGYGTNTAFLNFTLNVACRTLATAVNPVGSGTVNASAQNCTGGYTDGTLVQLTAVPNAGYLFSSWSGSASGTSNPVSVTMDGDKSVTANFEATLNPLSPSGTLTSWDSSFSWTGLDNATWYLIEVQTSAGTQVFRKWYTSAQSGCSGGTACSVTQSDLILANGDYKWRVMDYGAYGYGSNSAFRNFTLNLTCYSLTTNLNPAGSGVINTSAQNCAGGYNPGSIVQLSVVPGTGFVFSNWSGDASGKSNPVTVTMNADRNVTANMRGNTPLIPSGPLTSWSKAFSWTGLSDATWYLLEVQTSTGTQVFRQWYTSAQTGCSGGTACSITPAGLNLANGDYKWRILDYGAYGYGLNSAFKNFTLDLACYTLAVDVNPAGKGTVTVPGQSCAGGYTSGSILQLTAIHGTDYLFSNWSGDASGSNNPLSLTMTGNKNITANFTVIPTSSANLFTPYVNHPVERPSTVGVGDFNQDGLLDAAVTNDAAELKIFYQNQSGSLGNETTYAAGPRPEGLAVGDLNHDGRDDIVVTNVTSNTISVFLQLADGSLAGRETYATGTGPDAVAVGDVNGDGLDDVAVSNWNSAYISVFTQNIDGSLNVRVDYPSQQAGYDDIAIGDVNNDGLNDIVKMNGQGLNDNLLVYIQNINNTFDAYIPYSLVGCTSFCLANGIGIGDVTGDGRADVVMSYGGNRPNAYVAVFSQAADGSLGEAVSYSAYDIPEALEVADVNDDGKTDVVTVHGGWNAISVYTQQLDGTLGSYSTYPLRTNSASHYKPQALTIRDVNQDGLPDALLANSNYGLDILYHVPPDEVTPLTPAGSLSEWNNTFRWVGLPDATWYLLEVQTSGGTQVFRQWYTSTQTGCSGGTACSVAPTGLSLANGDYKWRILDYGAYGYGIWTSYMEFTLNQ